MEINLNIEIDEIPKKLRNELGRALLHNGYRKRRKITLDKTAKFLDFMLVVYGGVVKTIVCIYLFIMVKILQWSGKPIKF